MSLRIFRKIPGWLVSFGLLSWVGLAGCATGGASHPATSVTPVPVLEKPATSLMVSSNEARSTGMVPHTPRLGYKLIVDEILERPAVASERRDFLPLGAILPSGTYTPSSRDGKAITIVVSKREIIVELWANPSI